MKLFDRIRGVWRGGASAAAIGVGPPPSAGASLVPQASFGWRTGAMTGSFTSSSANDGPSLTWARYQAPLSFGWYAAVTPYASERNRTLAAAVTDDLSERNPTLATIINEAISAGIGTGLTLSAKPKADRLGITEEQANQLAHDLEQAFSEWANNPNECDFGGRFDLTSLITAMYISYLRRGEAAGLIEWQKVPFARSRTKLRVIDCRQIDQAITRSDSESKTFAGVTFDRSGRWIGCWIRPYTLGETVGAPAAAFVPAKTPHGRTKIIHTFSLTDANQVRGKTPLVAALTPVKARETAGEFVLDGFYVQNQVAATITSDLPAAAALSKLEGEPFSGGMVPDARTQALNPFSPEWQIYRADFYKQTKIGFAPGQVTALAPGDKLQMIKSEQPHSQYLPLDKSLTRQAARAAGEAYETIAGDFADTSYSASRLAMIPPHRVSLRRRREIIQKIYQSVYEAICEEFLERGIVANPSAVPFWTDKAAYAAAKWRGTGPIVGDRYKEAKADELELSLGLNTIEGAAGDRGLDLEDIVQQQAYEKRLFESNGLEYPLARKRGNDNDAILNDDTPNRRARQ